MKVVCDNCRAVYKVPDDKLTKAVNKATCRNCGHRMLIPRPKPNADPEERTLVTAVPPTPVGAPPRQATAGDEEQERESTLPGRAPTGDVRSFDDLHMETPMMSPRIGDTQQAPDTFEPDPATHLHVPPSEQPTAKDRPPSRPPGRSPASIPPPRRSSEPGLPPALVNPPARRTPAPPQRRAHEPAPERPHRATPPGAQPRGTTPMPPVVRPPGAAFGQGPAGHDPANDLNWALFGTVLALLGGGALSVLSVWNNALVMWFGLAMTFGGSVVTLMVLLTGDRGRRPAQTLLSVVAGFLVAIVMSSLFVGTKWGVEKAVDVMDINFSQTGLTAGLAEPTAPGTPPAPPPAPAPEPAPVAPTLVAPEPVPQPEPVVPGRPPAPPPPPKPEPARPAPVPVPVAPAPAAPSPAPVAPPPAPAPAPPTMTTVPIEAVHVILSNNIDVKKCFVPLFKAGNLPPRVDARFAITPAGRATNVTLVQPGYRGSELEGCLSRSIGAIAFPPTSGSGTAITYPFVLQ